MIVTVINDNKNDAKGLECPNCGCFESHVYYTRRRSLVIGGNKEGRVIRRRQCDHCGRRFITSERVSG